MKKGNTSTTLIRGDREANDERPLQSAEQPLDAKDPMNKATHDSKM